MNAIAGISIFRRLVSATALTALLVGTKGLNAQTNTLTGFGALMHDTTGYYNTADGYSALALTTSGGYNTAAGAQALLFNTTGSYNSAFGAQALFNNKTGIANTVIGNSAMYWNVTGSSNTAIGSAALFENVGGNYNTANGFFALYENTASCNTATGYYALRNNSIGEFNTAMGLQALYENTTGSTNTASGYSALYTNMTGIDNVASGGYALYSNSAGSSNVALGYEAGYKMTGTGNIALGGGSGFNITTGNNNIAIANSGASTDTGIIRIGTPGVQTQTFVSGIAGTGISGAIPVYITSGGQLGVIRSSARFKYDIHNIGSVSDKLMSLRPVTFRYKDADQDGTHPVQYGLIAEEVAKVYPDLVQYDKQGKPFTVYYHLLTPMILDQLQKAHHQLEEQQKKISSLELSMQHAIPASQDQNLSLQAQVTSLQQANRFQFIMIAALFLIPGVCLIAGRTLRLPFFHSQLIETRIPQTSTVI